MTFLHGGNIMRTINTSDGEYCIVENADLNALYGMSENCRGLRRRCHFEEEANLYKGFCTKIKNKKNGPYLLEDIEKIVDAKDSGSNVTKEAMMAANGMLPMESLKRMLFVLQPAKKDVQDLRKREYAKPQYVHCDYYPDDRDRFNNDFAIFCSGLTNDQKYSLRKHQEEIFADKALVRMIYKYRKHKEKEVQAFVDNALKKDDLKTLEKKLHLAENYREVILDTIEEGICSCDSSESSDPKIKEIFPEEKHTVSEEAIPEYTYFGKGLSSFSKK